jgi:deglycase
MAEELKGMKVAFLATDMVEESELTGPWQALRDAGADVELVSVEPGEIQMARHHDKSGTVRVDRLVTGVSGADYDALVLPGGVANPDALRTSPDAVRFVRDFFDQGKPVGAICHAPWMLVEAGVVSGRTLTSWPSLATDLRNAGASRIDREVVVDDLLVTSRWPDDIPAFARQLIEVLSRWRRETLAGRPLPGRAHRGRAYRGRAYRGGGWSNLIASMIIDWPRKIGVSRTCCSMAAADIV